METITPISKNGKKFLFIIFFISLVLFAKFAPYGHANIIADTLDKKIFYLYFFIVNQTLGIVHEGGHGVCYILHCPEFITAAMGTVFQLLFPFLIGYYYKRKGRIFPFLMGLFFLGISLHYTAWYISTADQGLYLSASKSFLGVDGLHDFHYILSSMNILEYNNILAGFLRFVAFCIMIYSVAYMLLIAFFSPEAKKIKN